MKTLTLQLVLVVLFLCGCSTSSKMPGVRRSILGGASIIASPVNNTNGHLALLVVADPPPKVIQQIQLLDSVESYSFYTWLYDGFRVHSPKEVWLCSDALVADKAQRQGLSPSVLKKYSRIEHLSFKPEDIPKLCDLAASLGATHVVRARFLDSNQRTQRETRRNEKPNSGISIPTGSGNSIVLFGGGSTTVTTEADVTTVEMKVRCYVYQASDGALLFERDFDLVEKQPFQINVSNGEGLKQNFVTGVLREIESRNSGATQSDQPRSGSRPVNLAAEVWLRQYAVDQSYSLIDVGPRLLSLERIDQNIKLTFTLRNNMRDDLTVLFRERTNGKPEAFLRDEAGATYYASSTSIQGNRIVFRPGERKDFYLIVPLQSIAVKAVNFFAEWDFQSRTQQEKVNLRIPNLVLP